MSEKDTKELEILNQVLKNLEDNRKLLETLEGRSAIAQDLLEAHGTALEEIKEYESYWKEMAVNTGKIANSIDTYSEQNIKLIDVVAGKKQVPLSVFISVLVILGISMLTFIVSFTGIQVTIDPNHIEFKKEKKIESVEKEKVNASTNQQRGIKGLLP